MKMLLVPIDFSAVSRHVITEAKKLARLTQSPITLLHVVQPPPIVVTDFGPAVDTTAQFVAVAEKGATQHLAKLKAKLQQAGFKVDTTVRVGYPSFQIAQLAKNLRASCIVLGSHGHTALYDLLIGSTTAGVLKLATCPVMVIPMPATSRGKSPSRR